MTRDQKVRLAYAGGAALLLGGTAFLLLRRSNGTSGAKAPAELLEKVAATESGPDFESVVLVGPWAIWRKSGGGYTKLRAGSIVRLAVLPENELGSRSPHVRQIAVEITQTFSYPTFAVYRARWLEALSGVNQNEPVAFTSADIAMVVRA